MSFFKRLPAELLRRALPALAYVSLGGTTALALLLVVPLLSAPTGGSLVACAVGLPAASLALQLLDPQNDFIKDEGGVPADAQLVALAREAALAVGVAPPKAVYLLPAREPNAFACGLRSNTAVGVTAGLVDSLSTDELRAVLAHEMGHLKHRDVARNTHVAIAAAGLGGVYHAGQQLLRRAKEMEDERKQRQAARLLEATRRRAEAGGTDAAAAAEAEASAQAKEDEEAQAQEGALHGAGWLLIVGGAGMQAVAHLLRLAASRVMELSADLAAAEAYGASSLISALRKIHEQSGQHDDLRSSALGASLSHAMISGGPAVRAEAEDAAPSHLEDPEEALAFQWLDRMVQPFVQLGVRLLSTHPPLDVRVDALRSSGRTEPAPAL